MAGDGCAARRRKPERRYAEGAVPLDAKELRELIEIIARSDFATFELERDGFKLRLVRGNAGAQAAPVAVAMPAAPAAVDPVLVSAPSAEGARALPSAPGLVDLISPIVGIFYRAPSPEAPPFAEVGSRVKKGQVLCIVEAMKLMNEIESEIEAEVVEILVTNGQPVEYGEILFRLRPVA